MNEIKQHWNTSVQLAANLKAPKKNLGFSVSHANCGITTAVKPLKKNHNQAIIPVQSVESRNKQLIQVKLKSFNEGKTKQICN